MSRKRDIIFLLRQAINPSLPAMQTANPCGPAVEHNPYFQSALPPASLTLATQLAWISFTTLAGIGT